MLNARTILDTFAWQACPSRHGSADLDSFQTSSFEELLDQQGQQGCNLVSIQQSKRVALLAEVHKPVSVPINARTPAVPAVAPTSATGLQNESFRSQRAIEGHMQCPAVCIMQLSSMQSDILARPFTQCNK